MVPLDTPHKTYPDTVNLSALEGETYLAPSIVLCGDCDALLNEGAKKVKNSRDRLQFFHDMLEANSAPSQFLPQ